MSALITTLIGQQNFEKVRDEIGAFLFLELANQQSLGSGLPDIQGFCEQVADIDKTQMPAFNILFSRGEYERKTNKVIHGTYIYFIDVYANGATDNDDSGDYHSAVMTQRVIGMCRAILDAPQYRWMGFDSSFGIENAGVSSLNVMDKSNPADGMSSTVGRIVLTVKMPEYVALQSSETLCTIAGTTVQLGVTEYGYQYQFPQTE